ncbi:hypothetical protein ACLOJK_010322 [Asimina triloba]
MVSSPIRSADQCLADGGLDGSPLRKMEHHNSAHQEKKRFQRLLCFASHTKHRPTDIAEKKEERRDLDASFIDLSFSHRCRFRGGRKRSNSKMSALFNFHSFLTVVLLVICTCTYVKMQFPTILEQKTGYFSLFLSHPPLCNLFQANYEKGQLEVDAFEVEVLKLDLDGFLIRFEVFSGRQPE